MSVSRTPRKWDKGDAMPEDRPDVVDNREVQWAWDCEEEAFVAYGRDEVASWGKLLRLFPPLTEVLPERAAQYCPNTMERADECQCGECVPPVHRLQETPNPSLVSVDTGTPKQDDSGESCPCCGDDPKGELAALLACELPALPALRFADCEAAAGALLAKGWQPPLPKADVATLVAVVGGLIDEFFGDDHINVSRAAAKCLLDRGYLDKAGEIGPPEPVVSTLRRVIRDLEGEAIRLDGQSRDIGDSTGQRIDHIIGAQTLRDYAERLRSHPVLSGEGRDPLPADETEWEYGWRLPSGECRPAAEYAARRFCSIEDRATLVRRPAGGWEVTL